MTRDTLKPSRNRPTTGTAAGIALYSLLDWGVGLLPATVPDTVVTSLHGLGVAVIVTAIGWVVQQVGDSAPWSAEVHRAGVAYALSLDPEQHAEDLDAVLDVLGVDDLDEARRRAGLVP